MCQPRAESRKSSEVEISVTCRNSHHIRLVIAAMDAVLQTLYTFQPLCDEDKAENLTSDIFP